jgi:hypothetical protein
VSTAPTPTLDHDALRRETERLHSRYLREIVEALGFCPWAEAAREGDRVQVHVVFGCAPELAETLRAIDALASRAQTEVGFVIFPEAQLDRLPFSHFVAAVRAADAARHAVGEAPLAMADFHPNAAADCATAERLVPFVRRTPSPTIQLVRRSALEAVRLSDAHGTSFFDATRVSLAELLEAAAPTPALAQRVAKQNLRTVQKLGVDQVEAIFHDIERDRDATYARLGLPRPAWADSRASRTPPR